MVKTPVYMDYHATTPVDKRVVEAMLPFFSEHFGNAASLQHRFGWVAKEAVESARKKVAAAVHALPGEIVFTSGATESNNLALKGIAEAYRSKGNHIITTEIEHSCVLESCKNLERHGFAVTYLPVDKTGRISIDDLSAAITPHTILVSVMTANNEIGTIQPMEEIGEVCGRNDILFHTDAAQAAGRILVDVRKMKIHLLSLASHKMYGPKGVGALFIRSGSPRIAVETQMDGAGHERGIRSGTLNVAGIVGFGKAAQIAVDEMDREIERTSRLRDRLQEQLELIEHVSVNGHRSERLPNNLNMSFHGVNADQLMTEMSDVAISAGSACISEDTGTEQYSHVLKAIGLDAAAAKSSVRFGLGRFTTEEEVDFASERIRSTVAHLRELSSVGVS